MTCLLEARATDLHALHVCRTRAEVLLGNIGKAQRCGDVKLLMDRSCPHEAFSRS